MILTVSELPVAQGLVLSTVTICLFDDDHLENYSIYASKIFSQLMADWWSALE